MKISIVCFTKKGLQLEAMLTKALKANEDFEGDIALFAKYKGLTAPDQQYKNPKITPIREKIADWTYAQQMKKNVLVFVGAVGIAVRSIANGIKDKLTDSPVIVIDEQGQFVIPILSGHMGGANALAAQIAAAINAVPVITTATDIEGAFSPDSFARENGLSVWNREGISKVSVKSLEGKPIRLSIENYPPDKTNPDNDDVNKSNQDIDNVNKSNPNEKKEPVDIVVSSDKSILSRGVLGLCPKEYGIGIGCRKGTPADKLKKFVTENLEKMNIDVRQIGAIGSIDIKSEENGIIELARDLNVPFITFTKELLEKAVGEFTESEFVKETTGIGNVCERSAILLTGNCGEIVLEKTAQDGMTMSIAKCR